MKGKMRIVFLDKLPICQICNGEYIGTHNANVTTPAQYDAKTKAGPWAYVCKRHFRSGCMIGGAVELALRAATPTATPNNKMRQRNPSLTELAKYLDKQANGVGWKIQLNKELLQLIKEGKIFAERTGDEDEFRFVESKQGE